MTKKRNQMTYSKQLEMLSTVSKTITSNLYLEDILRLIVTVTAELMNSKICSLMLLDEKSGTLTLRATQSMSDSYNRKVPLKIGEGVAGLAAQRNEPVMIYDVNTCPEYKYKDIAKKEGLRSLLCVPLSLKGKVIGVINSYTQKPQRFSKSEVDILMTVANQAAMAIENAELLVKTKVIQEELETRKLVERAKGILMRSQALTEDEAFKKIQRQSMDSRRSMREIAEAVILMQEIQKGSAR